MGECSDHYRKTFDSIRRAYEWIESAAKDTVHFQMTHDGMCARFNQLYETEWFRAMPNWAREKCRGYCDGVQKHVIEPELRTMHLFRGYLFTCYDIWRAAYPDLSGAELSGSCVIVWKSTGKVHFASEHDFPMGSHKVVRGMVFKLFVPGETVPPTQEQS